MVTTWMDNNISSRDVRSLFTLAVQAVFSAELRDVSFLLCWLPGSSIWITEVK